MQSSFNICKIKKNLKLECVCLRPANKILIYILILKERLIFFCMEKGELSFLFENNGSLIS